MRYLLCVILFLSPCIATARQCYLPKKTVMNHDLYPWSLGTDVAYQYTPITSDYRALYEPGKLAGNIYLAYRTNSPWSMELGYSWTTRAPKEFNVQAGDSFFGGTASVSSNNLARLRLSNTYFDVHANLPISKVVEVKLGIGVAFVRQQFAFSYSNESNTDPVQIALNQITPNTALTGRVSIGLQGLITQRVGLRGMLYWQNFSSIRLHGLPQGIHRRLLGNGVIGSLGIFWIFSTD